MFSKSILPKGMVDGFLEAVGPAGICANMAVYFEPSRTQMDIGYDPGSPTLFPIAAGLGKFVLGPIWFLWISAIINSVQKKTQ